jgi:ABC-type enterochelin transport system substrate-binding protein
VEEEQMNAQIRAKATRPAMASLVFVVAVVLSACGATAAQQLDARSGSHDALAQGQTSAGSSSLDYDTLQHIGQLQVGVGSSSLDYDTLQHMGQLQVGVGSSSLDYDTLQHMGRLQVGVGSFSLDYDTARHLGR